MIVRPRNIGKAIDKRRRLGVAPYGGVLYSIEWDVLLNRHRENIMTGYRKRLLSVT